MSPSQIPAFVKLSDNASLYWAPQANGDISKSSGTQDEPCLIVICSWMGAAPKHIAKYTDEYRRLYPCADILMIEASVQSMFFRTDLTAALEVLASHVKTTDTSQPVLLHMFSNGGANNAINLASQLQERHGKVPFHAVVLDSCPGRGEVESGTRAMAFSLPKMPVVRTVGWYALYAITAFYVLVMTTLGVEDVISRLRRVLIDPEVFGKHMPRLYLYSQKDALVDFHHVHEHVEAASQAGYVDVREEVFDTAPHCALINEDADRYWDAVKACFDKAQAEK